jgi:phosphodiesterase/alkaline phosphatase D-like protein
MRRRFIIAVLAVAVVATATMRMALPSLSSNAKAAERRVIATATTALASDAAVRPSASPYQSACDLPDEQKSVRFAVIGDSGTGGAEQFQVAQQMEKCRLKFGFDFVLMLGDNIYGGKSQQDFERKFEQPYKALLDASVKFYATIGNHDDPNERLYKPFNMGGARYYSFKKENTTFFALDSNYMDSSQLDWLDHQLQITSTAWKVCFFHHPLYSDARYHGPDLDLRAVLSPIFQKYGVNLVLSGHDHVYERFKPANGAYYFLLGNSGELRYHDLKRSADMVAGFDTDRDFMLAEIAGDKFYFQTISRSGQVVDSGVLERLQP